MKKRRTIFSWGYWGWGNCAERFIKASSLVEKDRGFSPPLFVDVRLQRSGRAPAFQGDKFANMLPGDRYHWMKSLGNKRIATKKGAFIQIEKPEAAEELLDLVVEAEKQNLRLIYFCSCGYPKTENKIACHRWTVGTLLLKAARKRNLDLRIQEWPGGEPRTVTIDISPKQYQDLQNDRYYLQVGKTLTARDLFSIPCGSIVYLKSPEGDLVSIIETAMFHRGEWVLPISYWWEFDSVKQSTVKRSGLAIRKSLGLELRS